MMADSKPLFSLFIQERDTEYRLDGARNYLVVPIEIDGMNKEGTVPTSHVSNGINDAWRLKIAEWSFEVVDYFSLDREVVAIALNYIDRFMVVDNRSNPTKQVGKREYQLLTLTSLYLAVKLHGELSDESNKKVRPSLRLFIELSQNRFTGTDIEQMECKILQTLRWRVNPPMSITFVKCFLSFLPNWQTRDGLPSTCHRMKLAIYEMARYLTEISVCTSSFSFLFKPSVIAYASVLAAMDVLERDGSLTNAFPPYQILVDFFHYIFLETSLAPSMTEIKEARSMLIEMCPKISSSGMAVAASSTSVVSAGATQETIYEGYYGAYREESASPTDVLFAFREQ